MANCTDDAGTEATSLLDKILKKAGSEELSKSLATLIDIWTKQGKSKSEIEAMLNEFQQREEERRAQLEALDKKIEDREKDLQATDLQLKQLEEIRARIKLEIATLQGRIAGRERSLSELAVSNDEKEKQLNDLLKKLGI